MGWANNDRSHNWFSSIIFYFKNFKSHFKKEKLMKEFINRLFSNPSPYFKKIRNAGLIFTGVSAAILASPVALPAAIVTVVSYMGAIGATCAAISQITIPNTDQEKPSK
jgi:hypothetical protein